MIPRLVEKYLRKRLAASPAVALVGPRQCGKTTLARSLSAGYFDLEQESERLRLDLEWDKLCGSRSLLVLDEAQSWPEVFVRIRGAVDSDRRRMGRFLLLGSVSPGLMSRVSESLAGRLSLVTLSPFLLAELAAPASRSLSWLCGGYPDGGALARAQFPKWQLDYLALLSQRDLPLWGLPAKPQTTMRLLRMLAASHGNVWNASKIGQGLGINYKTVNTYLEYLTGAFLIRLLPAYSANIRKRLVRSPKIYWRDSGLLHALMNVNSNDALLSQPWVGASWEGWCIEQIISTLSATGIDFEPYYFRTSDQHEIDLVLDLNGEKWALEFKLTSSPGVSDMEKLARTADLIGASRCILVSKTRKKTGRNEKMSCSLEDFLETVIEI
jgi:uncharacterized protein